MGVHVAETLGGAGGYRFTDPDALLSCDNSQCSVPWVTRSGLVTWALASAVPCETRFTERVLVACSLECLRTAQATYARGKPRWADPMPVATWLAALADSLDADPATTPIGTFAGTA